MTDVPPIRRGFVDVPHGQVHFRSAGTTQDQQRSAPLLILHGSPGSSRQQLRMIAGFAGQMRVFAPDTPGNGDSVPLSGDEPTIAGLAAAMIEVMDALELDRVHLYGTHTGAAIASELAMAAPTRVLHLMLDGVGGPLTPDELSELLAHYAPRFAPDLDGAYLQRLFQFCRDQLLFFPWYRRTREARRDGGLGRAEDLHAWVVEVMKASQTYHHNYHAAFKWDVAGRLPLVACPTLLMAAVNDPLFHATVAVSALVNGAKFVPLPRLDDADFLTARQGAMARFMTTEG